MKWVITGGAGFIGHNLARALRSGRPSDDLVILDDLSSGYRSNLDGLESRFCEGSILDQELVNQACLGADTIVHLAARASVPRSIVDPRGAHDVNATGTLNVLEAARREGARVIVASSSSVYGANPTLPKVETMATMPMSPYAASKLATESYTLAWGRSYDLPVMAYRFFNVYGPGQSAGHAYAAVIPAFMSSVLNRRPVRINGDGSQTRDFTFVDTVCEILIRTAVESVRSDTAVNLALGTRTSLSQLVSAIQEVTGLEVEVEYGPPRVGDVPHSSADPSRLKSLFPDVSSTSLTEGLRRTYRWFLEQDN